MEQPNLSYIYSMSGGDKAFEKRLIDIIKLEFPQEKKLYYLNLTSKKFKLTAESVHKLKHKISILGLTQSYEVAVAFEKDLLEGNTSLKDHFESTLNTITNYLKAL